MGVVSVRRIMAGMLMMFAFFVRLLVGLSWRNTVLYVHLPTSMMEKNASVQVEQPNSWEDARDPVEFDNSLILKGFATTVLSTRFLSMGSASAEMAFQEGAIIDVKLTVIPINSALVVYALSVS